MEISIEEMESILMREFNCNRSKANFVANIIKDVELKNMDIAI